MTKVTNINCPTCEVLFEIKPQLQEIEDVDGHKLFRCDKCKIMFELVEKEDD